MSDHEQPLQDDIRLADLTVGEFKQLLRAMLAERFAQEPAVPVDSIEQEPKHAPVKLSLDDFMRGLDE